MWRSRWRSVIKTAYPFSFLLSINISVWQNVLYFLDAPRSYRTSAILCGIDSTVNINMSMTEEVPSGVNTCRSALTSQPTRLRFQVTRYSSRIIFQWRCHLVYWDAHWRDVSRRLIIEVATHSLYDNFRITPCALNHPCPQRHWRRHTLGRPPLFPPLGDFVCVLRATKID